MVKSRLVVDRQLNFGVFMDIVWSWTKGTLVVLILGFLISATILSAVRALIGMI